MRFDDRLATVLRQPVAGEAVARIQFRQLLDLLGTSPSDARGPSIDAAQLRLGELSRSIPSAERVGILRDPALRLRNPRLVALLAETEPEVAAAAIEAARLGEEEWLDLIPALPVRVRGFLRGQSRKGARVRELLDRLGIGERGLPPAEIPESAGAIQAEEPEIAVGNAPPAPEEPDGIGAIVRRIEAFRKTREQARVQASGALPSGTLRLPLEDTPTETQPARVESFDFLTDSEGRIVWSDPAIAPMTVGLALVAQGAESPVAPVPALVAGFRRRQPLRAALLRLSGAPAIAGEWQADAAPRFDRPGGRFIGYAGRMRRPAPLPAATGEPRESEADRMRQVLHELRTPVNAIQGFAEVIQQQLFGPTPHEYRALAASIASDSARILAGFEELDRLVKLDAGILELEPGECDLAAMVTRIVTQLEAFTGPRNSGFALGQLDRHLPAGMSGAEAERLVWRLLATLAGASGPGEMLGLMTREKDGFAQMSIRLPAALCGRDDEALFSGAAAAEPRALSAGLFGAGFALRLARAEARAAGGSLERQENRLVLSIPSLTRPDSFHSDGIGEHGKMGTGS